jgi:hypothetical protein
MTIVEERVTYLLSYLDRLIKLDSQGYNCYLEISGVIKQINELYGVDTEQ